MSPRTEVSTREEPGPPNERPIFGNVAGIGHNQTRHYPEADFRYGSKGDLADPSDLVRSTPESGHLGVCHLCQQRGPQADISPVSGFGTCSVSGAIIVVSAACDNN
jgi:hypothetical protein